MRSLPFQSCLCPWNFPPLVNLAWGGHQVRALPLQFALRPLWAANRYIGFVRVHCARNARPWRCKLSLLCESSLPEFPDPSLFT